jgi:SHS2 domain-containing protein
MSASHRFEDHTSEVALAIHADTLPELFRQAALALAELLLGRVPGAPGPDPVTVRVVVRSADLPTLLVDWINELVYRGETLGAVWSEIADLRVSGSELTAQLLGASQSELAVEVKAATLHDARVGPASGGFEGHLILDV